MNVTPLVAPVALARTYDSGAYADSYDRVQAYQRVVSYAAKHPEKGSYAVARALDLPRGQIRGWVDGDAKPDPVRGIDAAERRGWLDLEFDDPTFAALNRLVAWIFSGGSLDADRYVPILVVDDNRDRQRARMLFGQLGVDYRMVRNDDNSRAAELHPRDGGSVLGRVLLVLGAPTSDEKRRSDLSLPSYLDSAPERVRNDFAEVYLYNRGQIGGNGELLRFPEDRSEEYLDELATFFEEVSEAPIRVSERRIVLSQDARESFSRTFARPV